MNNKLRIGEIPYANLFPIFYTLKKDCDCSAYEFVEGAPSRVNKLLRDGEIALSPSSSIEYLKNPSLYKVIEGHSISSRGAVGSILLFTREFIEDLGDTVIQVSSQSETSIALLDIILQKFYNIKCELRTSESPEKSGAASFLLIGDDALKYSTEERGDSGVGERLVYDLGEIWYQKTGLPFVFALWIARAEVYEKDGQRDLLSRFTNDLDSAKNTALRNLESIAAHSPMRAFMSGDDILAYWNRLDYELTDEHKKGLELFRQYLVELELLDTDRQPM